MYYGEGGVPTWYPTVLLVLRYLSRVQKLKPTHMNLRVKYRNRRQKHPRFDERRMPHVEFLGILGDRLRSRIINCTAQIFTQAYKTRRQSRDECDLSIGSTIECMDLDVLKSLM